jgi:putative SOS response-associated peptidase YedK
MCGRYALTTPASVIAHLFHLGVLQDYLPRWNIAPTQLAPVIRADRETGERRLTMLRWGLVPYWAKDASIGSKMINARSETLAEKAVFRNLLERRRCVVPADAFYEWRKPAAPGETKQPFALRLNDDQPFCFAGLWDRWKGPSNSPLPQPMESYTILTTAPNGVASRVHDRMPVMLISAEQWDCWLDASIRDAAELQTMLGPIPDAAMRVYPVSRRVNAPANDDAELLREHAVDRRQKPSSERWLFE